MRLSSPVCCRWSLALILIAMAARPGVAQPPINAGAAITQKFVESVGEYVKVRKAALKDLPPLKPNGTPGDITTQQGIMADRIQAARSGAHQGDICTAEVSAELKRLIGMTLTGADGEGIRKSLRNIDWAANAIPLLINGRFPDKLPVASPPPTLLLNLPRLPAEVEYRFVRRALVLRDSTANVIIDFVPEALPVNR